MSSTKQDKREGVQPLDADDVILADSSSDEELSGASDGDGPLHQAEEATIHSTISGDGPEILRGYAEPSPLPTGASQAQNAPPGRHSDGSEPPNRAQISDPDSLRHAAPEKRGDPNLCAETD